MFVQQDIFRRAQCSFDWEVKLLWNKELIQRERKCVCVCARTQRVHKNKEVSPNKKDQVTLNMQSDIHRNIEKVEVSENLKLFLDLSAWSFLHHCISRLLWKPETIVTLRTLFSWSLEFRNLFASSKFSSV